MRRQGNKGRERERKCERGKRIKEIADRYGYAEYMIRRYVTLLGERETVELLEANEEPLPVTIQTNTLHIGAEELKKQLIEKGFEVERIPFTKRGLKIQHAPFSVGATTEYLLGYYTVQGAGSIVVGDSVAAQWNDQVIDMCAAPGMKTLQLSQEMENEGIIVAIDRSWNRLLALEANVARCGVKNVLIIQFDAKELGRLKYPVDKILLDAPCTGSGIIRKDFRRKRSREEEDIKRMAIVQKKLIKAGIDGLKEGGRLVYATCSLEPEENEAVISYAMNQCPVEVIEPDLKIGTPGLSRGIGGEFPKEVRRTRRLWPHRDGTEGFFIGVLRKCAQ